MEWLDRTLIVSPIFYGLCLNDKDFQKELKKLKIEEHVNFLLTDTANATAHFFTKDNKTASVVCLGDVKGQTLEQVYAILVHEATHLWQAIKDEMGEKTPSIEFEAYSIQTLSQNLFYSYKEQKRKVLLAKRKK